MLPMEEGNRGWSCFCRYTDVNRSNHHLTPRQVSVNVAKKCDKGNRSCSVVEQAVSTTAVATAGAKVVVGAAGM